ncbi:MAG: hypothetical protein CMO74_10415 [Verrucomicrobiales bacterium]|nr:hypothetical protein [Verrucomicrobiales bacterium]|tara:strand:- start:5269 stop:6630 length:1362 start_codon:yes stop_codon:yes gene_type:complete
MNTRTIHRTAPAVNRALTAALLMYGFLCLEAESPRRDAVVRAVEQVMPSVVNISTETVVEVRDPFAEMLRDFWGPFYQRRGPNVRHSLGSGVIIDPDGYLLTNHHVVQRATRITVKLMDGRELEAKPVAGTARSDLALLKIKAAKGARFNAVEFAKANDLLLGESVIALGNPFGLGGSVSRGILSSKQRKAPREGEKLDIANWLQTDAAINPGNSGGPLVNLDGKLIGINVAIHRQGQGIGFAIPIRQVNAALTDFFTPERLQGLWLGARVKPGPEGMVVILVEPGGPAADGGLRVGDRVISINGRETGHLLDWAKAIEARMEMIVTRAGQRRTLKLRLRPEEDFFNATLVQRRLGFSLEPLTEALAKRLRLSFTGGFVVTEVEKNGPAHDAGLRTDHVVESINGQAPSTLVEFARQVNALRRGDRARLMVVIENRTGNFIQRRQAMAEVTAR